jgi:CBS domain containing-hemolysin-like protein
LIVGLIDSGLRRNTKCRKHTRQAAYCCEKTMYKLLITFFLISIIVSFLCSLWEAVLLSITPSYAQVKFNEGRSIGRQLQSFKANIDRPLAAILTLNTIAHTVGAIGVGAQAAKIWADANPLITSVLVPAIMTLGILILSEIIPKTLGANQWQRLAPFTVNSLRVAIILLYPLVWLAQFITSALKKDKSQSVYSHSEFLAMAEIGVEEGHVEPNQSEIIENLLRLHEVQARDIMTPRPVVMSASEQTTIQAFYAANPDFPFSRIPLYEGVSREEISGYFLKNSLLKSLLNGKGADKLGTIKREIIIVHESYSIRDLFKLVLEKREHIALVVNEFGGMAGIVTMEDVIETLLGTEIIDEADQAIDMQALAKKKWEQRVRKHGLVQEPGKDPAEEGE